MVSRAEQIKIRRKVKRRLASKAGRKMFQFGQADSSLTGNGMFGCMDTSIQNVFWITKGKKLTLNQVRRATGARANGPTAAVQAAVGLRRLGLPYVIRTDLMMSELLDTIQNKGPVIIAYRYWAHPHWRGANYFGHKMNGWANNNFGRRVFVGFSDPLGKSGANQWGFRGGHAAVLAWARDPEGRDNVIVGVRDPNHGSATRPQRPLWDKISRSQLSEMLESIRPANAGRTLVFVPTRRVVDA